MEDVKKSKKSKKRRHRSKGPRNEKSLTETQSLDGKKNQTLGNVGSEIAENLKLSKSSQLIQTDISKFFEDESTEKDEEIKNLSDRLQQITSKLYESKNAYTSLKQEFDKVQKLLYSEVGENVSIAELSNESGGWRGRAEQIHQLQQKVSELQLKASNGEANIRRKSSDRRSASSVRIFDKEKKIHIENLTKELKEAESTIEATRKKLSAAKARIAVLENELNASKRTIGLLNEKTIHDNQLIDALHDQLKAAEVKFQNREAEVRRQNDRVEREIVLLRSEIEAGELHVNNFKRQLDDKDKEIQSLKCRNESKPKRGSIEPPKINSPRDSPRDSPSHVNEYIAIGIAAEAEKERLLELVTVLNCRLDKETLDYERLSECYKRERGKAAKLETKLQKMELERGGTSRTNTGSYRMRAFKSSVVSTHESADSEEIQLKFELLEEENLTLKTRLATILKNKASDLATFKRTLQQTRKIFRDSLRGKLPALGSSSNSGVAVWNI